MARPPRSRAYRKGTASYSRAAFPAPPVNGYSIELISPVNGATVREPRPDIYFIPTSILGGTVDVQVEWRTTLPRSNGPTSWSPPATYTNSLSGLASGDVAIVEPPTNLSQTTWWYLLRAGNAASNVWGAWTVANRFVDVQTVLGSVSSYLEMNVGVVRPPTQNATAYTDMNVGTETSLALIYSAAYSELNVGVVPVWRLTALYSDLNIHPMLEALASAVYSDMNVTTEKPDPVIWWIRPEQGKEGYVFNIYGHGFGEFQNQYDGKVMLGNYECAISVWEIVPGSPNLPPFIEKGVGIAPDVITTEHGWIVAVVPTGAVSAMVKVVLESG